MATADLSKASFALKGITSSDGIFWDAALHDSVRMSTVRNRLEQLSAVLECAAEGAEAYPELLVRIINHAADCTRDLAVLLDAGDAFTIEREGAA